MIKIEMPRKRQLPRGKQKKLYMCIIAQKQEDENDNK